LGWQRLNQNKSINQPTLYTLILIGPSAIFP
jgi:hypothetical protein